MDLLALWNSLGPWSWLILAGLFLIVELAAPGIFFIWLALAAAAVGALSFAVDLAWQIDVVVFAALSVVFVLLLRPWYSRRNGLLSDQPHLNQRLYNYVGQVYGLEDAIESGRGKLRIEDTLWDAIGPDLPRGARVKVTGVDGLKLRVEAA